MNNLEWQDDGDRINLIGHNFDGPFIVGYVKEVLGRPCFCTDDVIYTKKTLLMILDKLDGDVGEYLTYEEMTNDSEVVPPTVEEAARSRKTDEDRMAEFMDEVGLGELFGSGAR